MTQSDNVAVFSAANCVPTKVSHTQLANHFNAIKVKGAVIHFR